ncbi:MAG: formylglycine-generating enzyme family protein [Deltaproteobacteria bacterium]|nr:formylglycine-generating enzyme family protein [Deltaproteobacteria bacterium]
MIGNFAVVCLFAALAECGSAVVPMDPLDPSQIVRQPDGSFRYRRPPWCAPCAPCDCACADRVGDSPRTEHVILGLPVRITSPYGPEARVTMSSFRLGRYELTNRCAALCRLAGGCSSLPAGLSEEDQADLDPRTKPDHPAGSLTRENALRACRFLGGDLPTSAQWEFAARGTDGRLFPWGNEVECGRGNYTSIIGAGDSRQLICSSMTQRLPSARVGSFASGAGPYGSLDLAGGVREWVSDYGVGSAWFTSLAALNARGQEALDPTVPAPTEDTGAWSEFGVSRGPFLLINPVYLHGPPNTDLDGYVYSGARCRWPLAPAP